MGVITSVKLKPSTSRHCFTFWYLGSAAGADERPPGIAVPLRRRSRTSCRIHFQLMPESHSSDACSRDRNVVTVDLQGAKRRRQQTLDRYMPKFRLPWGGYRVRASRRGSTGRRSMTSTNWSGHFGSSTPGSRDVGCGFSPTYTTSAGFTENPSSTTRNRSPLPFEQPCRSRFVSPHLLCHTHARSAPRASAPSPVLRLRGRCDGNNVAGIGHSPRDADRMARCGPGATGQ